MAASPPTPLDDSPKSVGVAGRRLRARFTLRFLLVLMIIASVVFCWWRDRIRLEAEVQKLRAEIAAKGKAHWSVAQMIGAPDTPGAGDIVTAWASATQDGQKEWIELTYAKWVWPKSVSIHETYNPGAVYKIGIYDRNNREHIVWKGTDPTPPTARRGVSTITLKNVRFKIRRVRVYLDSPRVPGWNEIDAVGLTDTSGGQHWAIEADASSTYGTAGGMIAWGGGGLPMTPAPPPTSKSSPVNPFE